jgi:hypothetical protein
MGFLSNLRNSITGNWADVTISAPPATRGQTVPLTVNVSVKDAEIEFEKVVVEVTCAEIVEINNYSPGPGAGAPQEASKAVSTPAGSGAPVNVHKTESLFAQTVNVAGPQKLDAGSQRSFEANVALPAHLPPSVRGRHARYEWKIRASVDMRGNDPDSGWQPLEVR